MRLLYGHTCMNPLSRFAEKEIPQKLLCRDMPTRPFGAFASRGVLPNARSDENKHKESLSREFLKKVQTVPQKPKKPEDFGIEKFSVGTRVSHAVFGNGKIVSLREMGGDTLYEVAFDNGATKKLMATYAKLKKI